MPLCPKCSQNCAHPRSSLQIQTHWSDINWNFFLSGCLNSKTSEAEHSGRAERAEITAGGCVYVHACVGELLSTALVHTVWLKIQMSAFRIDGRLWGSIMRLIDEVYTFGAAGSATVERGGRLRKRGRFGFDAEISPWGMAGRLVPAGIGIRNAIRMFATFPKMLFRAVPPW